MASFWCNTSWLPAVHMTHMSKDGPTGDEKTPVELLFL